MNLKNKTKNKTGDLCLLLFIYFFLSKEHADCPHACNCNTSAARAAAGPLKLRMRAKLTGYKSCGAIWQQSASLTRCRGRTGEPHTQVIWLTCSWLTTSAVFVCPGLRACESACGRGGHSRPEKEEEEKGEEELPSAPSREFGHRQGKLGGGRRGKRIPNARPRAEAECAWLSRRCAHSPRPVRATSPKTPACVESLRHSSI